MVHIPRPEVAVAGLGVALLAGEGETFAVAGGALVDEGLSVGEVSQVLDGHAVAVGYPAC